MSESCKLSHGRCRFLPRLQAFSYVPEFLAKTELAVRSLPRSFSVPSLGDFVAGLTEDLLLLCPVRAFSLYVCMSGCSAGIK